MKINKQFISLLLLLVALNTVNAQIEDEIKSFVDSTELLVTNGRKLILHNLQAKDYQKIAETYNFINQRTSTNNCDAFFYSEDLYILSKKRHHNCWYSFFG